MSGIRTQARRRSGASIAIETCRARMSRSLRSEPSSNTPELHFGGGSLVDDRDSFERIRQRQPAAACKRNLRSFAGAEIARQRDPAIRVVEFQNRAIAGLTVFAGED